MYKRKKVLALIPARGGSRGIPEKNIYPINGVPLILYTINTGSKSEFLDGLYCSTDDAKIAQVAESSGKCKIIPRPTELATDTSKTIDSVRHALRFLDEKGEHYDYVMILQPTSPLRTSEQIDGIIRYVVDNDLPSCVSISELPYLPVLMRYVNKTENGVLNLENLIEGCGTCRRQDSRKNYYVDGVLYLYKTSLVLDEKADISLNDSPYGYEISLDSALDINEKGDIPLCEFFLSSDLKK